MKWFALVCLACALGCQMDIDLGNDRQPDAGVPEVKVVTPVACPPPVSLLSYKISLDPTPVANPGCWNDDQVPNDHTLPAETFEVLMVQRQTLGVVGLAPQKLGDAPVITVGAAFGGAATSYEWVSSLISLNGIRQTSARFDFDRIDTLETGGTLSLTARWSCPPFTTCITAPDHRSCNIERRFVATVIEPKAAWTTLTTPVLAGAKPYLVVLHVGALSRPEVDCTMGKWPETYELTPAARAIEVWQIAWPLVRLPPRSYVFPGAPRLEVESDFGSVLLQQHVTERDAGIDARETRTTTALLNLPCSNEAGRGLELTSRYECDGGGCASLMPEDPARCSVSVPFFAFEL